MEELLIWKLFPQRAITRAERDEYARIMANWTYLSHYLSTRPVISQTELVKMILTEIEFRRRQPIIARLITRLVKQIRIQLVEETDRLLLTATRGQFIKD